MSLLAALEFDPNKFTGLQWYLLLFALLAFGFALILLTTYRMDEVPKDEWPVAGRRLIWGGLLGGPIVFLFALAL